MADEVDLFQLHIGLLNSSHAPKKLREKARDFVRQLYDPVLKKQSRTTNSAICRASQGRRVCMAWACCYRRWGTRVLAGDNDIKYHHPLDLEPEDIAEAKRLFPEFADVSLTTQQFTHRYIRAVNATQTFPKPELAEALAQMHALLREHGWEQEEAQGLWRHEKFRSDDPLVGDPITFETTMNEEETVWREVEDEAGATDKSTSVADLEKRLKEFAKTATHA